jgi:hypothetical protein
MVGAAAGSVPRRRKKPNLPAVLRPVPGKPASRRNGIPDMLIVPVLTGTKAIDIRSLTVRLVAICGGT